MPIPKDAALYRRVVADAKRRFDVWPSAYASGWVVQEYRRRGGSYRAGASKSKSPLARWYKERWVDVCSHRKTPCGRPSGSKRPYPYCRPSRRVTRATPVTVSELTPAQRKRLCSTKRRLEASKRKK